MSSNWKYPYPQRLAAVLKSALIACYLGLSIASTWLLSGYSIQVIAGRIVPYGVPALLSLICAAFLSIFVLTLERIRTETLLFSIVCLAFAGLNLDILLVGIVDSPDTALTISRIDHFFLALIQLGASLHLVFRVCEKKTDWWLVYTAYGVGFFMALSTPTDYYFDGMYHYYWGYFARQGVLYSIMSLLWIIGLAYSIRLLVVSRREADHPARKDRITFLLYGFVCTAVLSLTNTPAIYGYEIYPLGTFSFISLFLLAYGLYKYNIRLAIQQFRTVLFHVGFFVLAVTAGLLPMIILPHPETTPKLVLGIVIIAALHTPLRRGWDRFLDLFFKRSPDYLRKAYADLVYRLSRNRRFHDLHRTTAEWLFSVFVNSRCAMVFFNEHHQVFSGWRVWNPDFSSGFFAGPVRQTADEGKFVIKPDHPIVERLRKDRQSLVTSGTLDRWIAEDGLAVDSDDWVAQAGCMVPVFYQDQLSGLLVIGNRINDRSYSRAEKAVLSNLGIVLAPSIENARILEGLEEQVQKRTRALHDALDETRHKSRQISIKNELITRQNHIILSLFETTTHIHEFEAFEQLFSFILKQLRALFADLGFAILIEGGRSDILESGVFAGLSQEEQKQILENRSLMDEENADRILSATGSADGDRPFRWTLLPMVIRNRRLGKMIIRGRDLDPGTRQVIAIFMAQVSAVALNKLLMHRLETIANTDGLTGIANRACFEKAHALAVHNAKRFSNIAFSIMIIDINGLKTVNDNHGHDKGDEMITAVADLLASVCRETDTLSRFGGDEFAILMPATDSAQAARLFKRIREREAGLRIRCREGAADLEIPVRVSIGLAGSDEARPENVLKLADQRMYADKAQFYQTHKRNMN